MTQKIGILGGTFNPPHIGHLIMANEVKEQLQLDKICFLPNQLPPHKEVEQLASGKARVAMLKLAITRNPGFVVDQRELQRAGKSYTYDTIREWKKTVPDAEFYFIIGGDMVENLPSWHKIDELAELVTFVGVNRKGYQRDSAYRLIKVDIPFIELSSTLIRERISHDQSVRYLVPEAVARYIKENRLYE